MKITVGLLTGMKGCALEQLGRTKTTYMPDFKKAFDHFVIHPGGRGVIDEIEKQLNLENRHTRPSRDTLYHYGNTSSSSVW